MLLRFGVSNFLSFDERQELTLVATNLKDNVAGLIRSPSLRPVLPAALVYGPNASGKSNLVAALRFFATAVEQSHRSGSPDGGVPRHPFALKNASQEQVSAFDADFVVDGVRYHYGFECTDRSFTAEWLFTYPQGTQRKLFERNSETDITFGPSLKGPKTLLRQAMRPNSLFLSTAAQNNHVELGKIASFFSSIQFNRDIVVEPPTIMMQLANQEVDPRAIRVLDELGTGVVGINKERRKMSENSLTLQREVMEVFRKFAGPDFSLEDANDEMTIIHLLHRSQDGGEVPFDLARESSGTRRLLILLSSILAAMDKGEVIVIDELDASLHTHAAEVLISLFADTEINQNGAQLIATTHDTNLMQSETLRRDQIWFVEKNSAGASYIYPLADFQTRQTDNIEKGYMQGRFGAIPFSGAAMTWLKSRGVTKS